MDSHNIRVFQSQDILCPHDLGQPYCSAASDSLFWVAYYGIIKGYSTQTTQKEFHCLYEFQPLWNQVDAIHYLPDIRRVITVERRVLSSSSAMSGTISSPMNNGLNVLATSSNLNADFKSNLTSVVNNGTSIGSGVSVEQCCRVYHFDYDKKERKTIITPSTLPIQHFTTFASGDSLNSELLISVCTYSNQLLTCVKDVISLWKFTNHDTSVCVLKLHTSWNVKCISVFNQFIGYGTTKDVRVVELKLKDSQKFEFVENIQEDDLMEEAELQNNSEILNTKNLSLLDIQKKIQSKIQDQFIGPTIETQSTPTSTSILQKQRNGSGPLTNKTMAMYWGKSQLESCDEIQIRLDMATKELLPSPATQKYSEAVAITPEERKKKKTAITFSSNIAYDIVGETTTVDHPAFVNTNYIEACTNLLHKHFTNEESPRSIHFLQNISQKRDFNQNTGMKCILSTSTCGYVYGLSSPQQLLCEFEYTGECLMSAVNSLFLYAITPVGLEIWSVLGSNNGCLLRFHPFIGLKNVSATDKHVILLSKMSSNENVSIAAYYNQQTEKTVLVSDMRSIEKVSRASTAKEGSRSGSLLPIFSARRKKEEPKSTAQPIIEEFSYNIYALNSVELCEIYEDMLEHAIMYKTQDNDKYMKLLKESHSLLQSKYFELLAKEKKLDRPETDPVIILKTRVDLQNYTTLLKRSFGLIGDAYVSAGQIDKAAYAYSNSDRAIDNVFKNLSVREESLLLFLDHVLFDNDLSSAEMVCSEDLGDKILSIYRQRTPHRLSNVILSNSIKFSRSHAISLLHEISDEYIKAQQTVSQLEMSQGEQNCVGEQSWFDIMPKDAIVLSFLQLNNGEAEQATTILKSVEGNCLVDFLINYPNLLTCKSEPFSLFAKTLREHAPWCLLEAIVRLTSANCCPLEPQQILNLLKGENIKLAVEELPITPLVMQQTYLSSLLIAGDYTNEKMLIDNALLLLKVFISELEQITLTLKQSNIDLLVKTVKSKVDLINSLNSPQPFMSPSDLSSDEDILTPEFPALISNLTQLQDLKQYCSFLHYSFIPFRENLKWPKEFVNYEFEKNSESFGNVNSKTLSEKYNDVNSILESISIVDATLFALTENDPFLMMIHLLYSAQGLICFFVQLLPGNSDLFQEFIRIIESSQAHTTIGFETLKILCMTGSRQLKEGIERLFEILGQVDEENENFKSKMDVLFGFIQEHCKTVDEWKSVLQLIFEYIQKVESNNSKLSICPKFLYNLLDRVLRNLALTNTPEEFLTLIPKNGSMKFFFTYIQLCYSHFTMNITNNSNILNFEIL